MFGKGLYSFTVFRNSACETIALAVFYPNAGLMKLFIDNNLNAQEIACLFFLIIYIDRVKSSNNIFPRIRIRKPYERSEIKYKETDELAMAIDKYTDCFDSF